jgi:hypothetical protein
MSFKTVAVITAIVGFVLGAAYLFLGELVVGRWQIEPTSGVLLLSRRIGVIYLGLSLMFFLARSAPVSVARTALSAGIAFALMILALLGIYELTAGHVAPGILVSVSVEFLIALAYIRVLLTERKAGATG